MRWAKQALPDSCRGQVSRYRHSGPIGSLTNTVNREQAGREFKRSTGRPIGAVWNRQEIDRPQPGVRRCTQRSQPSRSLMNISTGQRPSWVPSHRDSAPSSITTRSRSHFNNLRSPSALSARMALWRRETAKQSAPVLRPRPLGQPCRHLRQAEAAPGHFATAAARSASCRWMARNSWGCLTDTGHRSEAPSA